MYVYIYISHYIMVNPFESSFSIFCPMESPFLPFGPQPVVHSRLAVLIRVLARLSCHG